MVELNLELFNPFTLKVQIIRILFLRQLLICRVQKDHVPLSEGYFIVGVPR